MIPDHSFPCIILFVIFVKQGKNEGLQEHYPINLDHIHNCIESHGLVKQIRFTITLNVVR